MPCKCRSTCYVVLLPLVSSLINTWNNLSCGLLLVVFALLVFLSLSSALEKTEVKVDKNLLCDGVKLNVKWLILFCAAVVRDFHLCFFAICGLWCFITIWSTYSIIQRLCVLLAFWKSGPFLFFWVEKNTSMMAQSKGIKRLLAQIAEEKIVWKIYCLLYWKNKNDITAMDQNNVFVTLLCRWIHFLVGLLWQACKSFSDRHVGELFNAYKHIFVAKFWLHIQYLYWSPMNQFKPAEWSSQEWLLKKENWFRTALSKFAS